ncbi:hypothetical protein V495_08593 [Pseudogymnoascus sp. VKM F-4514 (FW-929)]|nr:hypothetical protein V495_08593 [Pseudogymnoascus sp. VKM F-4514 (FW-929)]KFY66719.1 hypothetical protein V497_00739 [Pseudogymnoascus sp. VKM F-4516 (FW-969)]
MAMQAHRDTVSEKVTPPGSFTAPLTPPPTDQKPTTSVVNVLQYMRGRKNGRNVSKSSWLEWKLQPSEYDELLCLLKNDKSLWVFVETKVRYDYDPTTNNLALRMPTQKHEVFIARVVKEIERRLSNIADSGTDSSSFAQGVKYNGSGRLTFQTANNDGTHSIIERQPDAVFKHKKAGRPGVIIEVSYSQKSKAIPHLADNYILESNANIRVVVGLDLDYKTKKATVSMWRPKYVTTPDDELELEAAQTVHQVSILHSLNVLVMLIMNQDFRDEQGNANTSPGAGLRLELRDFAPPSLPLEDNPKGDRPPGCARDLTDSFLIDSVTLCRFLDEAEKEEQESKQEIGFVEPLQRGARKRYRTKTPPEQLNSEDESKFEEDERRVRARVTEDDSSYKTSESE